jgi:hypothetical protein
MNEGDREVLAVVAKFNRDMGQIVLALTSALLSDDSLPPGKLRDLASICDEMSALLDNRADEIDPPPNRQPLVVPAAT